MPLWNCVVFWMCAVVPWGLSHLHVHPFLLLCFCLNLPWVVVLVVLVCWFWLTSIPCCHGFYHTVHRNPYHTGCMPINPLDWYMQGHCTLPVQSRGSHHNSGIGLWSNWLCNHNALLHNCIGLWILLCIHRHRRCMLRCMHCVLVGWIIML